MTDEINDSLVDVLLATFNGEKYLCDLIESIKRQTHSNWNMLVSDDGSTDATVSLVEKEINKDQRIHWAEKQCEHAGSYANFMCLLSQSTADYVMFCDQDDVWLESKIRTTLEKMKEMERLYQSEPIMVFTDLEVVDHNLKQIFPSFDSMGGIDPHKTSLKDMIFNPVAPGCTIMLNKELRDIALRLQNRGGVKYHDWWVSLIAAAFGHIGYVPTSTIKYRQHSDNQVGATKQSVLKSFLAATWNSAKGDISDSMDRAIECRRSFGEQISSENQEALLLYTSIPNQSWYKRIILLLRAGFWKRGLLRKIGQTIVTVTMSFPENERIVQ